MTLRGSIASRLAVKPLPPGERSRPMKNAEKRNDRH